MLKPSSVVPSNGVSDAVIAGNGGGKKVRCTRETLPLYNVLVSVADSGNHHARLAVSGIIGLSAGHKHMDNIYKPSSKSLSNKRGDYLTSVLPGIMVVFKEEDNGSFTLVKIILDDTYTKQQREHKSPGLWKAKSNSDDVWNAKFIEDGKLSSDTTNRFVIVSDKSENKPEILAKEVFEVIKSSRDKTTINQISRDGFDLHYTPGKGHIGGMTNLKEAYKASSRASLEESAEILAHTMYNARNISGVVWGSESGGSGVLTQAMQILADQGVVLETHGIFLNRATTLPSKTIELARKLGIESDDISKKSTLSFDQLAGQLCFFDTPISNIQRVSQDDNYSFGNLATDTAKSTYDIANNTSTSIAAAGLLGAGALASSTIVTTVGGILACSTLLVKAAKKITPEATRKYFGSK